MTWEHTDFGTRIRPLFLMSELDIVRQHLTRTGQQKRFCASGNLRRKGDMHKNVLNEDEHLHHLASLQMEHAELRHRQLSNSLPLFVQQSGMHP